MARKEVQLASHYISLMSRNRAVCIKPILEEHFADIVSYLNDRI